MAGVIAAHSIAGMSAGTHLACRCNKTWVPFPEYHLHLAQELTKAGYGLLSEAAPTEPRRAAAIGWDAAVAAIRYEDGTPVDIAMTVNPYRDEVTP